MKQVVTRSCVVLTAAWLLSWSVYLWAGPNETISFPVEYRKWAHVKSALVGPPSPAAATEAGIHHVYANEKAMEGYNTGKFPDGSIIVYDLLETKETGGVTTEGAQRRVDVMVKDGQRYQQTGGWGFARFWGTNRSEGALAADRQAECFGCHSKRKDHDAVFSDFRK